MALGPDGVVHVVYFSFIQGVPNYTYYRSYDPAEDVIGPEIQLNVNDSQPSSENDIRVAADSNNVVHILFGTEAPGAAPCATSTTHPAKCRKKLLPLVKPLNIQP